MIAVLKLKYNKEISDKLRKFLEDLDDETFGKSLVELLTTKE